MSQGSVIKGSSALIVGRMAGMAGSLLLFMLLTWRSTEVAGEFRVAITFLIIMDFLPLLGMHRWLAAEIARRIDQQAAVFSMCVRLAVGVAGLGGAIYLAIAYLGLYSPGTSDCLKIVAVTTVASALHLCSMSALVGVGASHQVGLLSLGETLLRSGLAIMLVLVGASVFWILIVFMGARYGTAAAGIFLVRSHISRASGSVDRSVARAFLSQIPNLALSMVGFLAIRNAAMLLLPIFRDESSAGLYAAAFQLFDMTLLIPTVLAISTNYAFVESAAQSREALRETTNQLVDITALFILPAAILGIVFARPIIEFVFGIGYSASVIPFQLLLVAAVAVSLDQVLALNMAVSGKYRADRGCMLVGALATVGATCLFSSPYGTLGAAAAFLGGTTATLVLRLYLMRNQVSVRALAGTVQGQAIAAIVSGLAVGTTVLWFNGRRHTGFLMDIVLAALGGVLYCLMLYLSGGLSNARVRRIQVFMTRRG